MVNAVTKAYEEIKSAIMSDAYPAGTRIKEELVAQAIGVSRTPIREALRKLTAEGFLTATPNQGARVTDWSEQDLTEIIDLRAILESFGAGLAAEKISTGELQELELLATQMERAADNGGKSELEALTNLNSDFHMAIINATGNSRLAEVIDNLAHPLLIRRRFSGFDEPRLQRSMMHHREIIDALKAHNSGWARATMRAHILASHEADLLTQASSEGSTTD